MAGNDEDRFRVKPAAPKSRGGQRSQRFVSQVLKQVSKTGARPSRKSLGRPANTFGRGRVAASRAGQRLGPNARRVVVKSRFVTLRRASPNSVAMHLRYIERDGVTRDGQKGQAYGADNDAVDLKAFQERGQSDRHQFRFIVSPEDGSELEDLKGFTRQLMGRMEIDLETRLDWVAVDHWDTDNPHTHIVLNGRTAGVGSKRDLIIAPDYLSHGMRLRASEIATEWLGPRTDLEIRRSLQREVDHQRVTSLDRVLIRQAGPNGITLSRRAQDQPRANALRTRLQHLESMGLAEKADANRWTLKPDLASTLDAMGQRADALAAMRRALKGQLRECVVHDRLSHAVIGRIAGKGLIDELNDHSYLVVDAIDGRAHYLKLPASTDLAGLPIHGIVEARSPLHERPVDRHIATIAVAGLYKTSDHVVHLMQGNDRDPQLTVEAHVRRLEALRRSGLVERVSESTWRVPADLPERARQHDAQRLGGASVTLHSHLPIERQMRVFGATWLDRQLIEGATGVADRGFGVDLREALRKRADFLVEQGLAERRGGRVVLARNLLGTLRHRDLDVAARVITGETGLSYQPCIDGERVFGVYTRNILVASGRFAMLEDGMGFTLVPWRPVIGQRVGQQLSAVVHGSSATWQLGKTKSISP